MIITHVANILPLFNEKTTLSVSKRRFPFQDKQNSNFFISEGILRNLYKKG